MSRSRSFESCLRPSTPTADLGWKEGRRLHLWRSTEDAETPFPGLFLEPHARYLKLNWIIIISGPRSRNQVYSNGSSRRVFRDWFGWRWYKGEISLPLLILPQSNFFVFKGLGNRSTHQLASLLLPRRAQAQQFLQAHGPRSDANTNRSDWSNVYVRRRREHESSLTAWSRYDC